MIRTWICIQNPPNGQEKKTQPLGFQALGNYQNGKPEKLGLQRLLCFERKQSCYDWGG